MSKGMMGMVVAAAVSVLQPAFGPVLQAQGPQEGIKVHGHWVIDVRQPDGTLVSHTEFENALTQPGADFLRDLLMGHVTMGKWAVVLPTGPCHSSTSNAAPCNLVMPPLNVTGPEYFDTLVKSAVPPGRLVLRGSFTATRTNPITRVETRPYRCGAFIAPSDCTTQATANATFSGTDLESPVQVNAGQIVQITVTLSFS